MTDVTAPPAGRRRQPPVKTPLEERPIRDVEAPLSSPSATTGLLEVFRRHYLLRLLVRREISARYQGSFLGLLWSYINPLSQFVIYYFVMGVIFGLHQGVENFAIHMFCGIVIVHFFNETFSAGTRSIVRNKSLVQKMAMPREMFPVASMLVSAYHLIPELVILVIVGALLGWTPTMAGMAAMVASLVICMVLGTGLALMFATANVFFRDVGNFVSIITNFVRFGVPMMYPYTMVQDRFGEFAELYLWNPISVAVLLFQEAFWVGTTKDPAATAASNLPADLWSYTAIGILMSLVVLAIGQLVFSRTENRIPERL
ncbi:ABC transporter permease [Nocardioides sp. MAH-18]|uniref:Transport permease protein n=1 Tax=Nocardioides agri TaxID=2682843 RepID=A0A6L6XVS9_9ACTN|nr:MULTISPECIES: ABC transporter permease [unclassified Nocardioides]MBA2956335.1 ABC transporter permease [Nocardioides sp. CGMCC 1.13656]MVQ51178.1 ABC transporter permease [Nocardioides sp. MAH-18]